jgi:hypothetical protein
MSALNKLLGDLEDDYSDAYTRCEDRYYAELGRHEKAFEPFLDVLEGFDKDDFRWAVNSENRVEFILDSIKDLDLVKLTINPNHTPPEGKYQLGPSGWRVDVIHSGGIFGYILPAVRADERVSMYAC